MLISAHVTRILGQPLPHTARTVHHLTRFKHLDLIILESPHASRLGRSAPLSFRKFQLMSHVQNLFLGRGMRFEDLPEVGFLSKKKMKKWVALDEVCKLALWA